MPVGGGRTREKKRPENPDQKPGGGYFDRGGRFLGALGQLRLLGTRNHIVPAQPPRREPPETARRVASPARWTASARRSDEPHRRFRRSEEHTSELQSLMRISYAVFCLKKKTKRKKALNHNSHELYIHHSQIITRIISYTTTVK